MGCQYQFLHSDKKPQIAIEAKISTLIDKQDLRGLIEFTKEHKPKKSIVVSQDTNMRVLTIDDIQIHIMPIEKFLKELWAGNVLE